VATTAQDPGPAPAEAIGPIQWQLTGFVDTARGSIPIEDPAKYTIQFLPDGRVAIDADCNQGSASYKVSGNGLQLGPITATHAACEPESFSKRFLKELGFVRSFVIDQSQATDQLVMGLMADGGMLQFSPVLTGVVWAWENFEGGDGSVTAPDDPSSYTLEFQNDGSVTSQVDCNRGMGTYEVDGASIAITVATNRMLCDDGSLASEFNRYVTGANTFVIRNGKLALSLPVDSGIATFVPRYVDPSSESTPETEGESVQIAD